MLREHKSIPISQKCFLKEQTFASTVYASSPIFKFIVRKLDFLKHFFCLDFVNFHSEVGKGMYVTAFSSYALPQHSCLDS